MNARNPNRQSIMEEYLEIYNTGNIPQDLGIAAGCNISQYLSQKYKVAKGTIVSWARQDNIPRQKRKTILAMQREDILSEYNRLRDQPIPNDFGICSNLLVYLSRKFDVSYATAANITRSLRNAITRPNRKPENVNSVERFFASRITPDIKKQILWNEIKKELSNFQSLQQTAIRKTDMKLLKERLVRFDSFREKIQVLINQIENLDD